MVLYDNDLICIFMNINENLELRKKNIGYTSKGVCVCLGGGGRGNQTYIEHTGHFIIGVNAKSNGLKSKCALVI